MLLTSQVGCPPRYLGHGITGLGVTAAEAAALAQKSINLKALQEALVQLSTATHNPAINPGTPTGGLIGGLPDDKTMAAVAASLGLIGPKLPTIARAALMIALGIGATSSSAKQAVLDYAPELRKAVIAATATAPFYVKPEAVPEETAPTPFFATSGPWYKTWYGIGAIAIGALGVLSLIAARRQQA
jgi:hypothetical protein